MPLNGFELGNDFSKGSKFHVAIFPLIPLLVSIPLLVTNALSVISNVTFILTLLLIRIKSQKQVRILIYRGQSNKIADVILSKLVCLYNREKHKCFT